MLDWLPGNGKQRVNAKHRICRGAVTAKRHGYRARLQRRLRGRLHGNRRFGLVTKELVTKLVSTETDVFRRLVDSAVDSAVDSTFGASENFSFQPQVSKRGFHWNLQNLTSWGGTQRPGTQAGTQGKRFSLVHTRVREGCAFYGVQELLRVTRTPKGASNHPLFGDGSNLSHGTSIRPMHHDPITLQPRSTQVLLVLALPPQAAAVECPQVWASPC